MAALVLSHWVLDFVVHGPDLPLAPGAAKVGLGLWNSVVGTIIVAGAIFIVGVHLYASTTSPRNRTGRLAYWGLVAFLVIVYVLNLGPPPPSVTAIGVVGLLGWLFVPWARLDGPEPRGGRRARPPDPQDGIPLMAGRRRIQARGRQRRMRR